MVNTTVKLWLPFPLCLTGRQELVVLVFESVLQRSTLCDLVAPSGAIHNTPGPWTGVYI